MKRLELLAKIFINTLTISAFTFGGGYVMIPLIKKRFCDKLGLIQEDEVLELIALGHSSPGAIAINACCLIGFRIAGFFGALAALFGTVLPPLVILSIVSYFYGLIGGNVYVAAALRGMQAGIAAVIADVVFSMASPFFRKAKLFSPALMCAAFIAAFFLKLNVIYIILASAALGVLSAFISKRRGGGKA